MKSHALTVAQEETIAWWHFQWPWRTPNPVFKVMAFLKSNISKTGHLGIEH